VLETQLSVRRNLRLATKLHNIPDIVADVVALNLLHVDGRDSIRSRFARTDTDGLKGLDLIGSFFGLKISIDYRETQEMKQFDMEKGSALVADVAGTSAPLTFPDLDFQKRWLSGRMDNENSITNKNTRDETVQPFQELTTIRDYGGCTTLSIPASLQATP